MSAIISEPKGLVLELLSTQGGKASFAHFYELIAQLEKTHSLDYVHPLSLTTLPAKLGEFDMVYAILRLGFNDDLDEDGNPPYTQITSSKGWHCWMVGFACLLFPASRHQWDSGNAGNLGDAADISIALLPVAQKQGYGRFVVDKLVKHAFNILGIPRVTASVICPVRPSYSAVTKKQVVYNTKQLCWIFEKLGFKFEGISRGAVASTRAVKSGEHVWHDVYRMSMLQTDYFEKGQTYLLSHTLSFCQKAPTRKAAQGPWESMMQRQEEEKRDVKSWSEKPKVVSVNDACENEDADEDGDDETMSGDDADDD
ncbi:unnamed protein product [Rhizoctonia solani]|uniref:N-acetyltransferase domain-containing protein n=1 Tax=Rhizoctonia solani TaxID=456999 RepID=A0A8H3DM31_9AGAM|nr:unnamed protein product [Rhizoctonia solani]